MFIPCIPEVENTPCREGCAHLKKDVDEQFVWKAEVNAGQRDDGLLDTKFCGAVLVEYSGTHVCVLASFTETTHLMVLGQLVVDLRSISSSVQYSTVQIRQG